MGDTMSDAGSEWSIVIHDTGDRETMLQQVNDLIMRMRKDHKKQQDLLRNQIKVMAAYSAYPEGSCVHLSASKLQAAVRAHAKHRTSSALLIQRYYRRFRSICTFKKAGHAVQKLQSSSRGYMQRKIWKATLSTFPERTKAALLARALAEKQEKEALQIKCSLYESVLKEVLDIVKGPGPKTPQVRRRFSPQETTKMLKIEKKVTEVLGASADAPKGEPQAPAPHALKESNNDNDDFLDAFGF